MNILNFKNISKIYKNDKCINEVLDDIDFKIIENDISLILGSSGVGKSTFLNIIGCLIRPDNGTLILEDKSIDLYKDNIENFRVNTFSYVFQDYNLLPEFNIYDNLLIPSFINNLDIKKTINKIDELLKYMNISNLKYAYPNQISHGEKQRVTLLRALLGKQKIILADEPTGNLDEINTNIILDLIVNINKDLNYTFIIASHDQSFVKIAKNVFTLKNKKILKSNE